MGLKEQLQRIRARFRPQPRQPQSYPPQQISYQQPRQFPQRALTREEYLEMMRAKAKDKNILNAHRYGNILTASKTQQTQQPRRETLTLVQGNTIPVKQLSWWNT